MGENPKGATVPLGITDPDAVRQALDQGLGDNNMQDLALGFGKMVDGGRVGKHKAVWAFTPGFEARGDVPHKLGSVPTFCKLWSVIILDRTPTGVHAIASEVTKSKWTETICRVDVFKAGGAIENCTLVFMVGGE